MYGSRVPAKHRGNMAKPQRLQDVELEFETYFLRMGGMSKLMTNSQVLAWVESCQPWTQQWKEHVLDNQTRRTTFLEHLGRHKSHWDDRAAELVTMAPKNPPKDLRGLAALEACAHSIAIISHGAVWPDAVLAELQPRRYEAVMRLLLDITIDYQDNARGYFVRTLGKPKPYMHTPKTETRRETPATHNAKAAQAGDVFRSMPTFAGLDEAEMPTDRQGSVKQAVISKSGSAGGMRLSPQRQSLINATGLRGITTADSDVEAEMVTGGQGIVKQAVGGDSKSADRAQASPQRERLAKADGLPVIITIEDDDEAEMPANGHGGAKQAVGGEIGSADNVLPSPKAGVGDRAGVLSGITTTAFTNVEIPTAGKAGAELAVGGEIGRADKMQPSPKRKRGDSADASSTIPIVAAGSGETSDAGNAGTEKVNNGNLGSAGEAQPSPKSRHGDGAHISSTIPVTAAGSAGMNRARKPKLSIPPERQSARLAGKKTTASDEHSTATWHEGPKTKRPRNQTNKTPAKASAASASAARSKSKSSEAIEAEADSDDENDDLPDEIPAERPREAYDESTWRAAQELSRENTRCKNMAEYYRRRELRNQAEKRQDRELIDLLRRKNKYDLNDQVHRKTAAAVAAQARAKAAQARAEADVARLRLALEQTGEKSPVAQSSIPSSAPVSLMEEAEAALLRLGAVDSAAMNELIKRQEVYQRAEQALGVMSEMLADERRKPKGSQ